MPSTPNPTPVAKKTYLLGIRLTEEERQAFTAKAEAAGMNLTDYARQYLPLPA
jgi:uncharacterized protein (DUF1778 family)